MQPNLIDSFVMVRCYWKQSMLRGLLETLPLKTNPLFLERNSLHETERSTMPIQCGAESIHDLQAELRVCREGLG